LRLTQDKNKVLDWTLFALDKLGLEHAKRGDQAESAIIFHAAELYEQGLIEVSFMNGEPLFSLTPEARMIMDIMKGTDMADSIQNAENMLQNNQEEITDGSE